MPAITAAFGLLGFLKPIKKFIEYLFLSFTNEKGGFSGRKLSAWFGVVVAAVLSYFHSTEHNVGVLVIYWLLFALLCMGLITFEQIIRLKNNSPNPSTDSTKTEETLAK